MSKLVHFVAEDVTRLLPAFAEHYEALRDTMISYSVKRNIVQPVRQQLTIPNTFDRFIKLSFLVHGIHPEDGMARNTKHSSK